MIRCWSTKRRDVGRVLLPASANAISVSHHPCRRTQQRVTDATPVSHYRVCGMIESDRDCETAALLSSRPVPRNTCLTSPCCLTQQRMTDATRVSHCRFCFTWLQGDRDCETDGGINVSRSISLNTRLAPPDCCAQYGVKEVVIQTAALSSLRPVSRSTYLIRLPSHEFRW